MSGEKRVRNSSASRPGHLSVYLVISQAHVKMPSLIDILLDNGRALPIINSHKQLKKGCHE